MYTSVAPTPLSSVYTLKVTAEPVSTRTPCRMSLPRKYKFLTLETSFPLFLESAFICFIFALTSALSCWPLAKVMKP